MELSRNAEQPLKFRMSCSHETRMTLRNIFLISFALVVLSFAFPAFAQSGLEGRITETINALVRIVNILIIGFVVWAGFLIAKGEGSGFQRLIYGIVGLIVANGAYVIINYFTY
jgi:hypothetical protein